MSLHYLLDGYNITRQIPAWKSGKSKAERENLIRLIDRYNPQGSRRNYITVVFDGRKGPDLTYRSSAVQIAFSNDISADEKIRSIVRKEKNKKNTIVITDDKELKFSVRALGARVVGVGDFLEKLKIYSASGEKKVKKPRKKEAPKHISKTLEFKINEELKNIWLDKK